MIILNISPILLGLPAAFSFSLPPSRHPAQISHVHRAGVRKTTVLSSTISANEELSPGISAVSGANKEILQHLENLRDSSYFRMYSVDILASCEYMPQELFECYSETCEVYPVDDDEIPTNIRDVDYKEQEFEIDGWARWDMPSNDYYDCEEFPEGYTGYDGSTIWNYIHNKICFSDYGEGDAHWKADFNKAVSGVHSLVSAQVVQGIQEKIDAGEDFDDDEIWRDPRQEFDRRLGTGGETPLALENLYFSYMLALSAAFKAKERLLSECSSGMIDGQSASVIQNFLSLPILSDASVGVVPETLHNHGVASADTLWEARMRSRELLRIMNCVQCNKCRLHGKLAVMGISTALQIHLGRDGEGEDPNNITRVELAALMTTIHRLSRAVDYCNEMS